MNDDEMKQIVEDLAYWQELTNLLGWKVIGWTFQNSALLETGTGFNNTLSLHGNQRDDIVRAIRNGR